jgi:transposase-like protein/transposase
MRRPRSAKNTVPRRQDGKRAASCHKHLLEGELDIAAVANLVGRHRNSINDWARLFRKGGIEALLTRGESSGPTPSTITWESSEGDSSHLKKDEEAAVAFKTTLVEKMKKLELPSDRKVKLWGYDEMYYGLHPLVRRVWSLKGLRVVTPVERRFEWGYLFGALEVGGGASEFLYSPTVNKEADVHFLQQIASSDEGVMHVVIGDEAGFHHRNGGGELPGNLKIIMVLAYSPELNLVEKLWDIVKGTICNKTWPSLEALEEKMAEILRNYWGRC